MDKIVRTTKSVCPVCLGQLPAAIVKRGQDYFLDKTCPDHGSFFTIVWRGADPAFETWGSYAPPREEGPGPDCPNGCGLCPGHLQKTCCVLVEVTRRCGLGCPVCFADAGDGEAEPSVETLYAWFRQLVEAGRTFLQLSGGEPTARDDLPEIIAAAKRAGCANIQLNSNGLRLGAEAGYAQTLKDAGLDFVFMQFDGLRDGVYETLRGRPLLAEKKAAIAACGAALLGVTLVPTVVPGVNDGELGAILDFAMENSPAVRGVHFQPVSYFGRYPEPPTNDRRITLPEILRGIEAQTGGKVRTRDLLPSACDHPRCGFHGDFAILPDKKLLKLTKKAPAQDACCDDGRAHLRNRSFVSRRWKRTDPPEEQACCGAPDYSDMDTFLGRIKSHGFTITAMAFQDAYNLDIERLRRCSLHVFDNGRIVPFCAKYLTRAAAQVGDR